MDIGYVKGQYKPHHMDYLGNNEKSFHPEYNQLSHCHNPCGGLGIIIFDS